ncbi:MAG: hypothetical protein JSU00_14455 [Acidobacteria bacterium]|nr:hypothetical protein [Acidobacteriota bacterium]
MRWFLGFVSSILAYSAAPPAFRLPDTARPTHYELELTIVPRDATFRGIARIRAEVTKQTQSLWLNSRGLTIESVTLDASQPAPKHPDFTASGEFLEIRTGDLPPGPVRLEIAWRGELSDSVNEGLYRKKTGGDWYAYTTFTPIEARRAFPCFDEPGYKAPWRVILHVPESDLAASNSPIRSETLEPGGLKRVEFDETRPIPSEVVAMVVGPFDVVDAGVAGSRRIPVRILAPRGRAREAEAARSATPAILARLEEYSGIPYPWEKLDHVAIADMPYGAVENPGLITYRDRIILTPPERDTPERRRAMRGTMAHELAHQWFGNLVTQAWWTDVWLSEGFATWFGGKVSDMELPDFERSLGAIAGRPQVVRMDSRPVRLEMHSREEMAKVYGGLVYQKGAAVLAMLEQWVGPEPFQRGLRRYLKEHSFSNATVDDLAEAIRTESGVHVSPALHSFLDQPGIPTIRVDRCVFEQESPSKWTIPVCFHGDSSPSQCVALGREPAPAGLDACPAWLWPNRGGTGYFHVRMPAATLEILVKDGWEQLPSAERLSVIDDIASMGLPLETVLKVLPVMAADSQPVVANAALKLWASLVLTASPADREKLESVGKQMVEGRRRR